MLIRSLYFDQAFLQISFMPLILLFSIDRAPCCKALSVTWNKRLWTRTPQSPPLPLFPQWYDTDCMGMSLSNRLILARVIVARSLMRNKDVTWRMQHQKPNKIEQPLPLRFIQNHALTSLPLFVFVDSTCWRTMVMLWSAGWTRFSKPFLLALQWLRCASKHSCFPRYHAMFAPVFCSSNSSLQGNETFKPNVIIDRSTQFLTFPRLHSFAPLLVQYHALGLLYHMKQKDRLAVSKLVSTQARESASSRSPYSSILLIRYALKVSVIAVVVIPWLINRGSRLLLSLHPL